MLRIGWLGVVSAGLLWAAAGCSAPSTVEALGARALAHDPARAEFVDLTAATREFRASAQEELRAGLAHGMWSVRVKGVDRHLRQQEDVELCWAACAQTLLLAAGSRVIDQREMQEAFINTLPLQYRQGAKLNEIVDALTPEMKQAARGRHVIDLTQNPQLNHIEIIETLGKGQPVMTGLRIDKDSDIGHVYVLVGLTYVETAPPKRFLGGVERGMLQMNRNLQRMNKQDPAAMDNPDAMLGRAYAIERVQLWDPWVEGAGMVEMTGADFAAQIDFAMSVESARRVRQDQIAWLNKHAPNTGMYVRMARDAPPSFAFQTPEASSGAQR